MADQIRVLVVDDIPETRDHLTKLLGFEADIEVIGSAASGREAIELSFRKKLPQKNFFRFRKRIARRFDFA